MILSFHPCFEGDGNINCAGREPDHNDRAAIRSADAVILPQGCRPSLYRMAAANCSRLFPDYRVRFDYPGKLGQTRLFAEMGTPHPETACYPSVDDLLAQNDYQNPRPPFPFPFVFKFDWGGEGDTVFLVSDRQAFQRLLKKAEAFEKTGQRGFLLQRYISPGSPCLRAVVIGTRFFSYWRNSAFPDSFGTSLSKGALLNQDNEPAHLAAGTQFAKKFCQKFSVNLAGMDFLFPRNAAGNMETTPLFLEINWFFGRRGIGGSTRYLEILEQEIKLWLHSGNLL